MPQPLKVWLQPLGNADWHLLTEVAAQVPQFLPLTRCQVAPRALPLPTVPRNGRGQWRADVLLTHLLVPPGYDRVVGIVSVDLFAPSLQFVFGIAEVNGQRALVSLARLTDADARVTRLRALKEVLHELGHTLGLAHCPDPTCVAAFSTTLADTDRKGPSFCAACHAQLLAAWQHRARADGRREAPNAL